jgi:hypothetical protein
VVYPWLYACVLWYFFDRIQKDKVWQQTTQQDAFENTQCSAGRRPKVRTLAEYKSIFVVFLLKDIVEV